MATGLEIFSVACNVMQTIQFAAGVINVCRKIHNGKSPTPEIDVRGKELHRLAESLQKSLNEVPSTDLLEEDKDVMRVAKELVKIAEDLKKELAKYGKNGSTSRGVSIIKTTKFIFRGSRIDKLDEKLKNHQKIMETSILVKLSKRTDLVQTTLNTNFVGIDRQLQDFIRLVKCGNTQLNKLVDANAAIIRSEVRQEATQTRTVISDIVISESADTRRHITSELSTHRSTQATEAQINAFLDSIKYPTMYARENSSAINESHQDTFEWIFEDQLEFKSNESWKIEYKRWSSFVGWLHSEEKIYWISGKPGSGKSSLIRFVSSEPRTKTLLRDWMPPDNVTILRVFIWSAGDEHQRSQRGMLATLLHQLVSNDQTLVASLGSLRPDKTSIVDWSLNEISKMLLTALKSSAKPTCIFIDGLDEIDAKDFDGWRGLLKLIKHLRDTPKVKLCLGSREELLFTTEFASYPHIRVQDLTRKDIKRYVTEKLGEVQGCSITSKELSTLAERIIERADGIFLWVALVTKNVSRDMLIEDLDQLCKRIDQLPSDLAGLYKAMWDRVNQDDKELYRRDSATYFSIALNLGEMNLFSMLVCAKPDLRRQILCGWCDTTSKDFSQHGERLKKSISARCAGLLDITTGYFDGKDYMDCEESTVRFIHRSARDFLTDTAEGQSILQDGRIHLTETILWSQLRLLLYWGQYSAYHLLIEFQGIMLNFHEDDLFGLEDPLLQYIVGTLSRFPVLKDLPKNIHLVELAAWLGFHKYVETQVISLSLSNSKESLQLKSKLLAWKGQRLFQLDEINAGLLFDEIATISKTALLLLENGADINMPFSEVGPALSFIRGYHPTFMVYFSALWNIFHRPKLPEWPQAVVFALVQLFYVLLHRGPDVEEYILLETSATNYHTRFCRIKLRSFLYLGRHTARLEVVKVWDLVKSLNAHILEKIGPMTDLKPPDFLPKTTEELNLVPRYPSLIVRRLDEELSAIQQTPDTQHIFDTLDQMEDYDEPTNTKLKNDLVLSFERDSMDGPQIMKWLIDNKFVSATVMEAASSPVDVVFRPDYHSETLDDGTHPSIDKSYKPEYDQLAAAVEAKFKGLRGKRWRDLN